MGKKYDHGKSPLYQGLLAYFPRALEEVANVSEFGARKYDWGDWVSVRDGETRYTNALLRHLAKEGAGETFDVESDLYHAAHVAWNALARLELFLQRQSKDTREYCKLEDPEKPKPMPAEDFIRRCEDWSQGQLKNFRKREKE